MPKAATVKPSRKPSQPSRKSKPENSKPAARTTNTCRFPQCNEKATRKVCEFGNEYPLCHKHLKYIQDRQEWDPFYSLDQEIEQAAAADDFFEFVKAVQRREPASWSERVSSYVEDLVAQK